MYIWTHGITRGIRGRGENWTREALWCRGQANASCICLPPLAVFLPGLRPHGNMCVCARDVTRRVAAETDPARADARLRKLAVDSFLFCRTLSVARTVFALTRTDESCCYLKIFFMFRDDTLCVLFKRFFSRTCFAAPIVPPTPWHFYYRAFYC